MEIRYTVVLSYVDKKYAKLVIISIISIITVLLIPSVSNINIFITTWDTLSYLSHVSVLFLSYIVI